MNKPNQKIAFFIGLLILFGQQMVVADDRPHSFRKAPVKRWKTTPAPSKSHVERRFDRHHITSVPTYRNYYKPGHRIQPLPYGYTRVFVNNAEYFFYDGYYYRPSRSGYVIVDAPIGAIVATIPRLHHIVHWHGQPHYIVGHTFYRRHPGGYIVVPDPGFGYWR